LAKLGETMRGSTEKMIRECRDILSEHNPMTIRQLYYQLVTKQIVYRGKPLCPNSQKSYKKVIRAMAQARLRGMIPWDWIEDRTRRPRARSTWKDLNSFLYTVRHAFRADPWQYQPNYLENWLEKDALSGIFEEALDEFAVILNVGRGYDSWDSIRNAANRFKTWAETKNQELEAEGSDRRVTTRNIEILYYGDFDPSGEDMVRSMGERLAEFEAYPVITKVGITPEQIARYNLPPDPAKDTDKRTPEFVAQHGYNSCVELDALPMHVLKRLVRDEVLKRLDPHGLSIAKDVESEVRARINTLLENEE